jgi:membrane-bound ClpP family serine protease
MLRGTVRLERNSVIILGIILIVVGLLVASLKILLWVGIVLLVVGLILNFVPIGGRRRRTY